MAYVEWNTLTSGQKLEAIRLRPKWHFSDFKNFAFWVKADGHVSRRGGHHELTEGAYKAIMARYAAAPGDKGGLTKWKPGVTFHFDKPPRSGARCA